MTHDQSKFPPITRELMDEMNERFPERSPVLGQEIERIWFEAGARSVVRFLQAKFTEQNETVI